jgi:Mlc titration factor MtfA (ptsG expression regulator)
MAYFALIGLLLLGAFLVVLALGYRPNRNISKSNTFLQNSLRQLLEAHVKFYRSLDDKQKKNFEDRVHRFLDSTRITGVGTTVDDLDRVLIGASAIIPIFAFPRWEYVNLNEVLLYPETFGENFETAGGDRVIMGMVGDGPMQRVMILSKHALREGFLNRTDKANTAIHEFVHLVDKTDGYADGVPEILMEQKFVLPWLELAQKTVAEMTKGRSDINLYGATNMAEFFEVAAEYFFERPDLLEKKHPELYHLLESIFIPSTQS